MNEEILEKLRFPIGRFKPTRDISPDLIKEWVSTIEELPEKLRTLVSDLNDQQLDTRYRPEGWTIRQVVYHFVDSHISSFIRFKWTLTEDNPTIKTYESQAESKDILDDF